MRVIEAEVGVAAPPAEVFAWVAEPGLIREWMPQLQTLRPRGFLRYRPLFRAAGLRLALDVRVRRVDVPHVLVLDVRWRQVTGEVTIEVQATEDGESRVTWTTALDLPPLLRVSGRGVTLELARLMRSDLDRLARRLDDSGGEETDDHDVAGELHERPGAEPAPATDGNARP